MASFDRADSADESDLAAVDPTDVPAVETTPRPCWVAGRPEQGVAGLAVHHPYDGTEVAAVAVPGPEQVERAVSAAAGVAREFRRTPAHTRAAALRRVADGLLARSEEIAETITAENGKPLQWAYAEVARAASVFRLAADETSRGDGQLRRLDVDSAGEGRTAAVTRVPRGPVLGIAPFNFPLNLVAHKVAPALAVGAPIVIKPAPRTPLSALLLGELLADVELPAGAFSVLPLDNQATRSLVGDPRLPVVSFTGSAPVGWSIADAVPRKHLVLELGGNAAAVVCPDWSDPDDLVHAANRIAMFGNYQAGQSCIAVQRVIVHRTVADTFVPLLTDAVQELRTGDPHDPEVEVGPVVDVAAAERVQAWISEALDAGARLLTGGGRAGASIEPTLLTDVPYHAKVWADEVFGPVLVVSIVDSLDEAFEVVNDSAFGLQAGVFTHDIRTAARASEELEVGGVIIGDVPSFRSDVMPYGGVKGSGIGREGVRSAMLDLTEEKVTVFPSAELDQ